MWDVRVVKPLDSAMLTDAARHSHVVTVEDGIRSGGAGSAIADALALAPDVPAPVPVLVLGAPDEYIPQGKPEVILAQLGLDGPGIAASIVRALGVAEVVGG